jgi:hypothetical protein
MFSALCFEVGSSGAMGGAVSRTGGIRRLCTGYSRCHRILEQLLSFLSVVGLVQGCRHAAHRQSGWSLGICGLLSNRGSGGTIVLERHNL